MQKCANNVKEVEYERIKLAIIAANKHYAGFGPGTVNVFRNMLVLPEAKWEERRTTNRLFNPILKQRTLTDFLG